MSILSLIQEWQDLVSRLRRKMTDEIARISKLPNLVMEGMFTHFAKSDEEDKTFTKNSWRIPLDERGIKKA